MHSPRFSPFRAGGSHANNGVMKTLWNDEIAAQATGGEARGHWHAARVEIDSRKVQLGDLYVAIKGERFDGHSFVADALSRGAVAALVSHVPEGVSSKAALLMVPDTLKALEDLAHFARKRAQAKVVGITGSVGKTSAKEMIKLALSAHGKTYATTGNYNNHIGTPLNLANLPPDAAFAVFEMGMNHAGEIAHLTKMVQPHIAVITNVEAVHLEFFASLEGIAKAKAEIFEGVAAGGVAVLNQDSEFIALLRAQAAGHTVITFGESDKADMRLINYRPGHITAHLRGAEMHFALATQGKHWAYTALMALAVTDSLALPQPATIKALAHFSEVEGRGKVAVLDGVHIIDDSYNASPASMRAAFAKTNEVWEAHKKGRKIAALGDMLELGADATRFHTELAQALVENGFDVVLTTGPLMQHLHNALPPSIQTMHASEAKALVPLIQKQLAKDDVLLIKGSHGSTMHEVASLLLAPPISENANAI